MHWRHKTTLLAITTIGLVLSPGFAGENEWESPAPFALHDGDRVVFLGNSFFERARDHGHVEAALSAQWPHRAIRFRNLGWDGDTVYGHARAGGRRRSVFGDPEEGFQRMLSHVRALEPDLVFVAYGFNESFAGDVGLEPFRKGLDRLLEELKTAGRRFVLITPLPAQAGFGVDSRLIDARNVALRRYGKVIVDAARVGRHRVIDLLDAPGLCWPVYYENGLHASEAGYRKIAALFTQQLGLPESELAADSPEYEALRRAIVKKNTLYFHRWRPRNDAFVYGERKDEQKIAQSEPEQFEPHIARQEQVIRQLLDNQS